MESQYIFNGDMARAARVLVRVSAKYVAREAKLARDDLRGFERGRDTLSQDQQDRVQAALEGLGAVFLPDGPNGGYGVRLKFGRSKMFSLDRWEGEGGPASHDRV